MRKVRKGVKKRKRGKKRNNVKRGRKKETMKSKEERKEEQVDQKEENNKGKETHLLRSLQGCRIIKPSIPCERTYIVVRKYISTNSRNGDAVVGIMKFEL